MKKLIIFICFFTISCYKPSQQEIKKVNDIKESKLKIQDCLYNNKLKKGL